MRKSFYKTTSSSLPKLLLGLLLLLILTLTLQACGSGDGEEDQPQRTPVTVMVPSEQTSKPSATVATEEAQPKPTPVSIASTPEPTPKLSPTVDGEDDQPQITPAAVAPTSAPTPKPSPAVDKKEAEPQPTVDGERAKPQPSSSSVASVPSPCPAEGVGSNMSHNAGQVDLDALQLASNSSNFAFDLYRTVSDEQEGNLFFSPYSISQVLAMAYAGARGETERQIADTLRYSLPQDRLHPAFNALDGALRSRGSNDQTASDPEEKDFHFRLNIANAVWGQDGFRFHGDYAETLAKNYGDEIRSLDFAAAPEECRVTINDWVANETEGKIQDLFPPGTIDARTRLVLTNAIYFTASWLWPFPLDDTVDRPFHLLNGGTVEVPMMTDNYHYKEVYYAQGHGFQAVEIPYRTWELSMIVLLADEGEFEDFEDSLTAEILDQAIKELEERDITLTMPRFEFESEFMLDQTLAKMGMSDAFSGAADFSGISTSEDLWISAVAHKVFVSVNEEGTEAAAATGAAMFMSAPLEKEPVVLALDRPFIFLIRDEPTGAILFLGRVMDPR